MAIEENSLEKPDETSITLLRFRNSNVIIAAALLWAGLLLFYFRLPVQSIEPLFQGVIIKSAQSRNPGDAVLPCQNYGRCPQLLGHWLSMGTALTPSFE
jgi:hypothetical protein